VDPIPVLVDEFLPASSTVSGHPRDSRWPAIVRYNTEPSGFEIRKSSSESGREE
jgi:hypothetical protein